MARVTGVGIDDFGGAGPSSRRSSTSVDLDLPGRRRSSRTASSRCAPVEPRHPGDPQDLERVEPPRAGGHHPDQRDVVVRVRDRPQRLLQVADLRRLEQRQPADDRVRDVLVAQPGDDRLAVLVLAVEDGDVRPAAAGAVARRSALIASTMATASSSGPAQTTSSTGSPSLALGARGACRARSGSRCARSAGWRRSGRADRAEVLLDAGGAAAGRAAVRVGSWRAAARSARRTRRRRRSWRPGSGRSTGRRRRRP